MILVFGFAFTDFTARTVETIVASPASSASKMMIDFALETLARFRSSGLVGSPVRVITFNLPTFGTRDLISESIKALVVGEKITTLGFRTFWLAIASSERMGKTRLDQPRMRV